MEKVTERLASPLQLAVLLQLQHPFSHLFPNKSHFRRHCENLQNSKNLLNKSSPWRFTSQLCLTTSRAVVDILHHANRNHNILLPQVKRTIAQEPTTRGHPRIAAVPSPSHRYLPTTTNTHRDRITATRTLVNTSKSHIAPLLGLTEMIVPISKIMEEVDRNKWPLVSLHQDKELLLHADIAEDAR